MDVTIRKLTLRSGAVSRGLFSGLGSRVGGGSNPVHLLVGFAGPLARPRPLQAEHKARHPTLLLIYKQRGKRKHDQSTHRQMLLGPLLFVLPKRSRSGACRYATSPLCHQSAMPSIRYATSLLIIHLNHFLRTASHLSDTTATS